jgi:hypothetical protein
LPVEATANHLNGWGWANLQSREQFREYFSYGLPHGYTSPHSLQVGDIAVHRTQSIEPESFELAFQPMVAVSGTEPQVAAWSVSQFGITVDEGVPLLIDHKVVGHPQQPEPISQSARGREEFQHRLGKQPGSGRFHDGVELPPHCRRPESGHIIEEKIRCHGAVQENLFPSKTGGCATGLALDALQREICQEQMKAFLGHGASFCRSQ